ncbi:hypothetical protein [Tsukamurella paurometabola]|uniref:PRC-barrel domain-containing protein n=1 Tax=Tsukamurella paurometabola TaxID=2061 RepID=A0ABS5NDK5_TSUPA|nr:hypothetical protein [Tsukamurella paurometabola]MBS4102386.1 hypothetical protein [Tsukamurella paurometabola]
MNRANEKVSPKVLTGMAAAAILDTDSGREEPEMSIWNGTKVRNRLGLIGTIVNVIEDDLQVDYNGIVVLVPCESVEVLDV